MLLFCLVLWIKHTNFLNSSVLYPSLKPKLTQLGYGIFSFNQLLNYTYIITLILRHVLVSFVGIIVKKLFFKKFNNACFQSQQIIVLKEILISLLTKKKSWLVFLCQKHAYFKSGKSQLWYLGFPTLKVGKICCSFITANRNSSLLCHQCLAARG